ncbi:MAG: GH116 family glycosyl hydrolase [Melioribacteraceae bacterium]|nr:GH116 family glycosyl hydrolase [Melioribacteraceae bacterium]
MKKLITLIVLLNSITFTQQGFVRKFDYRNDITLTRVAQSTQYFDKIGQKAALMGFENGSFEFWIWPWKVLKNFDLQFFIGSSTQPIQSKEIVKEITVTPNATIISFVYESFTINEIIFIPYNQTASIILLDVKTTIPLSIVPGFIPVMQPQWPAGIGGQYSYWNNELNAYVISESQRRGTFLCGSPFAKQMTAPPAHMFADSPIQFRIDIKPNDTNNFLPIIIAGIPQKNKFDDVKNYYNSILKNVEKLFYETKNYYIDLLNNTINISTPNEKLNLAFKLGKIALKNLLVENPNLGKGLVAGYGLSGNGGRPGFAWFFGGDAFINSLALNSFQDFNTVKDALKFAQKWQREKDFPIKLKNENDKPTDIGKMAHELSQSDGLIDWWNDYHYGYNHADTTPWYLVAISDYVIKSGDVNFLKQSWNSIIKAYEWCKSKDSNGDGLMDLKGAGLGVLEFGTLVKIFNDNYTQSIWTKALKEINYLSKIVGDKKIEEETKTLFDKALTSLEEIYWIKDLQFYSFGASENGDQVRDKNIYSSTPIAFNLYNKKRSELTIEKFNENDLTTDWGARNLSINSSLYDPANYNYGTVWSFNSFFIGAAQFNTHFNFQGYKTINNTLQNIFNFGLGVMPEVFSGNIYTKLSEAYHNQGFSVSGFIFPLVQGLLGIEVNSIENKISFAPKVPVDWTYFNVENIKVADNTININYKNQNDIIKLDINSNTNNKINFSFSPDLPLGYEIKKVLLNGKEVNYEIINNSQAIQLNMNFELREKANIEIYTNPFPAIYPLQEEIKVGSINDGIKIISQELNKNELSINCEVKPNRIYNIGISNSNMVSEIQGAYIEKNTLKIFVRSNNESFIKHKIIMKVKKMIKKIFY